MFKQDSFIVVYRSRSPEVIMLSVGAVSLYNQCRALGVKNATERAIADTFGNDAVYAFPCWCAPLMDWIVREHEGYAGPYPTETIGLAACVILDQPFNDARDLTEAASDGGTDGGTKVPRHNAPAPKSPSPVAVPVH